MIPDFAATLTVGGGQRTELMFFVRICHRSFGTKGVESHKKGVRSAIFPGAIREMQLYDEQYPRFQLMVQCSEEQVTTKKVLHETCTLHCAPR